VARNQTRTSDIDERPLNCLDVSNDQTDGIVHICCAQILPREYYLRLVVAQRDGEAQRIGVYIAICYVVYSRVDSCLFTIIYHCLPFCWSSYLDKKAASG